MATAAARRSDKAGIAAVISVLAPGLGHLYLGRWGWAVFWLIITPGFWVGSGGFLGWICHIAAAIQAYQQGRE